MTKVIVTVEQAKAIENYLKVVDGNVESLLEAHADSSETWGTTWAPMNNLSLLKLATALLVGYEIEQPKIEVGEWVKIKKLFNPIFNDGMNEAAYKLERIFKVTEIVLEGKILCPDRYVHHPENLCRATKEEAFWAELGRKVGELRIDDAYEHLDGRIFTVDKPLRIDTVGRVYKEGQLKGFYPAESFKPFPTGNE